MLRLYLSWLLLLLLLLLLLPGARGRCVASITPSPGLALLHLHGEERCLEHEARAVLCGSKYVLRSDVVFQV
jgi:hypothetical protein